MNMTPTTESLQQQVERLQEEIRTAEDKGGQVAIERFAQTLVGTLDKAGFDIGDEFDMDAPLMIANAIAELFRAKDDKLAKAEADCAVKHAALQRLWDDDEMGFITDGKIYECGQCRGKAKDTASIKHDDGCVQGYIHHALQLTTGLELAAKLKRYEGALDKLIVSAIEFHNDWRKGDFDLPPLAQCDMLDLIEKVQEAQAALKGPGK